MLSERAFLARPLPDLPDTVNPRLEAGCEEQARQHTFEWQLTRSAGGATYRALLRAAQRCSCEQARGRLMTPPREQVAQRIMHDA